MQKPDLLLLIVALLLCCCVQSATAQIQRVSEEPDYPGLDIQMTLGFDGRFEFNGPLPISFLASNQSEKILEGDLLLENSETGEVIRLGELVVGPRSVKKYSTIRQIQSWVTAVVRFTDGNTIFWERQLSVTSEGSFPENGSYLLFLDDGGRELNLKNPATTAGEASAYDQSGVLSPTLLQPTAFHAEGAGMRPVIPVTVRSWEFPRHHGPLTLAQGLVLDVDTSPQILDEQQWSVLGRWIATGGIVFLPERNAELQRALRERLPFPGSQLPDGTTSVAAGEIRMYSGQLFDPAGNDTAVSIARRLSARAHSMLYRELVPQGINPGSTPHSAASSQKIFLLFLGYMLATGGVLLMYKRSRQYLRGYLAVVVLTASVFAGAVGVSIRRSEGDLYWQSISEIGGGGLVQVGNLRVTSAGGSNFRLAATGSGVDLQISEREVPRRSLFGGWVRSGFQRISSQPSFTLPADWSAGFPGSAAAIEVPVVPWNSREVTAHAFRELPGDFSLQLGFRSSGSGTPTRSGFQKDYRPLLEGSWSVRTRNETGLALNDMSLKIRFCPGSFSVGHRRVYALNLDVEKVWSQQEWDEENIWSDNRTEGLLSGELVAWVEGTLPQSPTLQIDAERSEFEQYGRPVHWFIWRVPPEAIPESLRQVTAEISRLHAEQEQ